LKDQAAAQQDGGTGLDELINQAFNAVFLHR